MKRTGLIALAVLVTFFLAGAEMASALEPIPHKSGFSGFIRPAVGYVKYTRHLGEPVISATVSAKIEALLHTGNFESLEKVVIS